MMGRSLLREERRAALEAHTGGEPAAEYESGERPLFRDEAPSAGGYQESPGAYQDYPSQAYAEADQPVYDDRSPGHQAFGEGSFAETTGQQPFVSREAAPADDWPERPAFEGYFGAEAESDRNTTAAPADAPERVPFERPGPTPSDAPSLTDAGLPRRGGRDQQAPQVQQQRSTPEAGQDGSDWRSSNDDRWERAERLREPKAGGVTSSGLPGGCPRPTWSKVPRSRRRRAAPRSPAPRRTSAAG